MIGSGRRPHDANGTFTEGPYDAYVYIYIYIYDRESRERHIHIYIYIYNNE